MTNNIGGPNIRNAAVAGAGQARPAGAAEKPVADQAVVSARVAGDASGAKAQLNWEAGAQPAAVAQPAGVAKAK